jgi:hypothetical protein
MSAEDSSVVRFSVADGAWELHLHDRWLRRGLFQVEGSDPEQYVTNSIVAEWWVNDEGDPELDQTPDRRSEPQATAARNAVESYIERCGNGDWVEAIWDFWRAGGAVWLSMGEGLEPRRGVDAIVGEGLRWSSATRNGPIAIHDVRIGSSTRGRVACVTVAGLPWGSAVYLVVQSGGPGTTTLNWQIVSAVAWPVPNHYTRDAMPLDASDASPELSDTGKPLKIPRILKAGLDAGANTGINNTNQESLSSAASSNTTVRSLRILSGPNLGFMLSLFLFAFTRFWRLEDFPIYFHGDEAFQVVAARRLVENGFRNELGVLFPFYFSNGGTWAPLITTYLHVATTTIFGMSVTVARATTAIVGLFGALALGLFARNRLRLGSWWAMPLLLAVVPTWYLHSRTTFETAYCASGYAVFLWAYGEYRAGQGRWGAYAVLAAAFSFYTYTNGQLIVGLTALLLLCADARHHWKVRRQLGWVVAAGLTSLIPYVLYARNAPGATTEQLWRVSSYLVQDIPFWEKVRQFLLHYAAGLDPRYWFIPNTHELSRHAMLGYSYAPMWFFPFVALGVAAALIQFHQPAKRLVLVALIATPIGASVADVGITRVLPVVVPLALLTHIGLDSVFQRGISVVRGLATRWNGALLALTMLPRHWAMIAAGILWVGLAIPSAVMMRDSFDNGPRWFTDYGLYGQQWGAVQVFREISAHADKQPDDVFFVSSTWANGTDLYLPFFVPRLQNDGRVRMGNVRDLLSVRRDLTRQMVWVMTADEVELARSSKRFKAIDIDTTLPYPNGKLGFSFARLEYVANVEEVVAAERAARIALRSGQVVVGGERIAVRHSYLDAGSLADIFDNNPRTLGRFNGGNPATLEWAFPSPRPVGTVTLGMTAGNWHVSVAVLRPDGVIETAESDVDARSDPVVTIDVPGGNAGAIRVMISSRVHTDEAIIHLRDVTWQ